jgi:ketosteroid isomerase-like protein
MSRENVEVVRRAFATLRSEGIDAFLAHIDPEVTAFTAPEWIEGSAHHGHDGVRSLLSVWTDNFDDWTLGAPDLREAGESVVALFEHSGTIKGSSTTMRQRMGAVYSGFRNGRIGEARFFQSWEEALEAVGPSE